jgi:uncharacterized sulfatase
LAIAFRAVKTIGVLKLIRFLFAVLLFAGAILRAAAAERPNILWITCEDISPNLGCYGDSQAHTPNLDKLAGKGLRYTRAFAPTGVCATARSSLITGMYASSIGSQHMRCTTTLPASIAPFPTYLRRAGYFCTNQSKQDYNFATPVDAWNVGKGAKAHWKHRKPGQPFFAVFNYTDTHESRIRGKTRNQAKLTAAESHDPATTKAPPYLPDTPLIRKDWARYLDLITQMDKTEIPKRLKELEDAGLADDTIVFFFGDHGAGLPRAKQFVYDSGMQVPLLVYIPEKWKHLSPSAPGSTQDRMVSFVDFGPTVLSLAGVQIPKHMQGLPFLGRQSEGVAPHKYIYGIRDRMDERYDMTRTVRGERFKYHRNYVPFVPHYPWLDYMDMLDSSKELRRLNAAGALTGGHAFFMADGKPVEELYDLQNDPHELLNLADSREHRETLERMRRVHLDWVRRTMDTGLIPESDLRRRAKGSSEYEYARSGDYPIERILETALLVGKGKDVMPQLFDRLSDEDGAVRYWSAIGLANLGASAVSAVPVLRGRLDDESADVRVAAAQALCRIGRIDAGLPPLIKELKSEDPWLRLAAANAIDYVGRQAGPAVPAMQTFMASSDRENLFVRWIFGNTLRTLNLAPNSPKK